MKFTKPTIVELGSASEAIQFTGGAKINHVVPDQGGMTLPFSSGPAYHFDE